MGRNIHANLITDLPDGELELSGAIQGLHAEIHGVDDEQVLPRQPQFRGEVELAFAGAAPADLLQHLAFHIEHANLVAQGVRHVDPLGLGIDGNAG